jgi:hypothetical protein
MDSDERVSRTAGSLRLTVWHAGLHAARSPTGLLLDLSSRGPSHVLSVVDVATRQFPYPLVDDEPVPVHQQRAPLVVQHQRHRAPRHAGDVLGEPGAIRQLDIDCRKPDVPVLVHQAFATDRPPGTGHAPTVPRRASAATCGEHPIRLAHVRLRIPPPAHMAGLDVPVPASFAPLRGLGVAEPPTAADLDPYLTRLVEDAVVLLSSDAIRFASASLHRRANFPPAAPSL